VLLVQSTVTHLRCRSSDKLAASLSCSISERLLSAASGYMHVRDVSVAASLCMDALLAYLPPQGEAAVVSAVVLPALDCAQAGNRHAVILSICVSVDWLVPTAYRPPQAACQWAADSSQVLCGVTGGICQARCTAADPDAVDTGSYLIG
jgi:hypothetical protein